MQIPFLASILSHHSGAAPSSPFQSTPKAAAASSTTSTSSGTAAAASASASSMGITANDFLSLLVTEMKNQDPTQQTNPMTYITQLVGVNSLQQLMQINQDLTPTTTSTGSTSTPTKAMVSSPLLTGNSPAAAAANATTPAVPAATSLSLPVGSHIQMSTDSSLAVAQALEKSTPMAAQATPAQLPPSHVAVQPEELRAIQMSIPGATMTGASAAASSASGGGLP